MKGFISCELTVKAFEKITGEKSKVQNNKKPDYKMNDKTVMFTTFRFGLWTLAKVLWHYYICKDVLSYRVKRY